LGALFPPGGAAPRDGGRTPPTGYKSPVRVSLPAAARCLTLGLGEVAAVLLVRVLDEGLARDLRPLDAGHLAAGLLLAAAVMPGPILCSVVSPASGARARGLAFGGCVVTSFVALLGGALLARRVLGGPGTDATSVLALAWCAVALPTAAADALRMRAGAGDAP